MKDIQVLAVQVAISRWPLRGIVEKGLELNGQRVVKDGGSLAGGQWDKGLPTIEIAVCQGLPWRLRRIALSESSAFLVVLVD